MEEKCSLVPGMSLYDDVEMDLGSAEYPGSRSFSTSAAARDTEVSQELDTESAISGHEELSINNVFT